MQSKDSFFHLFCSTKLLFGWFHDNDCRNIWTFCCIYWILHFFHNTCLTKSTKVAWKKRASLRDDVFVVKLTPPLHSSHGKHCPQTIFAMTLFITKENRNKNLLLTCFVSMPQEECTHKLWATTQKKRKMKGNFFLYVLSALTDQWQILWSAMFTITSSSEGDSGSGQCSKVFSGPVGRTWISWISKVISSNEVSLDMRDLG